jgi:hypothetical protein
MANNSVVLSSLDFDGIKQNFIKYLQTNTAFKDYNFDSSNINQLLSIFSYNSYLNAFFLNMVASEMFLDSAQLRDSIVSHSKELNYVPRSYKSAKSSVSFNLNVNGITSPLTIPQGTTFSGTNANGTYYFVTDETTNILFSGNVVNVSNLSIYEGSYVTDSFIMDYSNTNQQFLISNPNVDTDSLIVTVTENNQNTFFTKASTLFGLDSTSNVFFLQAAQNQQYEIIFGDNLFGRIPDNFSTIILSYRTCNGSDSNGITNFNLVQDIGTINGGQAFVNSGITVVSNSAGGSNAESVESIRFAAPRYFAAQQRAVASDDYSSLVLDNFGGNINDVSVYGGELLTPKKYGTTAICLKPVTGSIAPDYVKAEILNYLKNYICLPNKVEITDPDYVYLKVTTNVKYDITVTQNSPSEIASQIQNVIQNYNLNSLNRFNSNFYFSRFSALIDNSDQSIISNDTSFIMEKRISPLLNYASSFSLYYNNTIDSEHKDLAVGYNSNTPYYDEPSITSTPFTYVDSNGVSWVNSYIRDNNFGILCVYATINGVFYIINPNIGTVDYENGIIQLNNFVTSYYDEYIAIYANPAYNDVLVSQDKIVTIDPNDVTITVSS